MTTPIGPDEDANSTDIVVFARWCISLRAHLEEVLVVHESSGLQRFRDIRLTLLQRAKVFALGLSYGGGAVLTSFRQDELFKSLAISEDSWAPSIRAAVLINGTGAFYLWMSYFEAAVVDLAEGLGANVTKTSKDGAGTYSAPFMPAAALLRDVALDGPLATDFMEFAALVAEVRNQIHNGQMVDPRRRKDSTVKYGGEVFPVQAGNLFRPWQPLPLIRRSIELWERIIEAPKVATHKAVIVGRHERSADASTAVTGATPSAGNAPGKPPPKG